MRLFFVFLFAVLGSFVCRAQDVEPADKELPVPESVKDSVFFVETDVRIGLAFLVEGPDGGIWMVSNNSVFQGAKEYRIVNAGGVEVPFPKRVIVAKDCDLVLFKTELSAGLRRADSCGYNEDILGFKRLMVSPEGKDAADLSSEELVEMISWSVVTQKIGCPPRGGSLLSGRVVALGPDRIEISVPLTQLDSGGPVFNEAYEVVGISSYSLKGSGLPDWVVEGTRFEEIRRFALRLGDVEWMPILRADYEREGHLVQEYFDTLAAFAHIVESLSKDRITPIHVSIDNQDIQNWLRRHNKLIEEYAAAKRKAYDSQAEVDRAVRRIERSIDNDCAALIKMVMRLRDDVADASQVTVPFYQQQLADIEKLYDSVGRRLSQSL